MPTSPDPSSPQPNRKPQFSLPSLCILLLLLVGGFVFVGTWYYRSQEQTLIDEHAVSLQSIAQLTTSQLLAWRKERLADARMNASGMVRHLALQWLKNGQADLLDDIRQRLEFFRENEGYYNMVLTDLSGRIHLSLLPRVTQLEPEEKDLLNQVLAQKSAVLGDFFYCRNCDRFHISVAAPVFDGDKIALVLLLVADPDRDIYPLISSWPIPHGNGESLLLRRDGEDVLALNQLRHLSVPPLAFRQPLTINNVLSQAVLGFTGQLRSEDYRGVEVLADAQAITETPWVMVTKIDFEEILSTARLRTTVLGMIVLMAMIIVGILVRLTSVARHKNLSEALLAEELGHRQTREKIRATLYSIGEGVIATDAQGKITSMNPVAEQLTGWLEHEALGNPLENVYCVLDEDTGLPMESTGQQVLRTATTIKQNHQHRLLRAKDGREHPIADMGAPIRTIDDTLAGVVLVVRDQSDRRAMEKARAESTQRYTDLVESVSDFIWETGSNQCFSFASSRVVDMLGYGPQDCEHRTWLDLLNHDHLATMQAYDDIVSGLHPYSQICLHCRHQNGREVILESSATPIIDARGIFLGYRGISRDITERKRSEDKQKSLQAQLLQSQKMEVVGRLAGGVAHDFNNMLTVISSYVEMMLSELDEQHHLYKRLSEVYKATRHSTDLTRQLLTFARKQAITPQVIDLNATIGGALKMLHRLIGEHIHLQWNPAPDLWKVRSDSTQIGQVLANLTINARDAIGETGNLTIQTKNIALNQEHCTPFLGLAPGDYVCIIVQDNGCGMNQEIQGQIFEPFFTTKGEGQGTGLGLATVYGIVKQNQGDILVSSTPGQGTTFTIYLPKGSDDTQGSTEEEHTYRSLGTETILLVEDETAILEMVTFILEQHGYSVLGALSPVMALQYADQYPGTIDLLLTDIIMPEMNGRVLAHKVLERRPTIKVLFMSGYTADILARHGGAGIDLHFIEKPFTSKELSCKIREILEHDSHGLHLELASV